MWRARLFEFTAATVSLSAVAVAGKIYWWDVKIQPYLKAVDTVNPYMWHLSDSKRLNRAYLYHHHHDKFDELIVRDHDTCFDRWNNDKAVNLSKSEFNDWWYNTPCPCKNSARVTDFLETRIYGFAVIRSQRKHISNLIPILDRIKDDPESPFFRMENIKSHPEDEAPLRTMVSEQAAIDKQEEANIIPSEFLKFMMVAQDNSLRNQGIRQKKE